jgi:hypothetical protein
MDRIVQKSEFQVHDDFVGRDKGVITVEDFFRSSGIAIGRGTRTVVVLKPITRGVEESAEPLTSDFQELVMRVQASGLRPDLKESLHANLEGLHAEVERAEAGDVGIARRKMEAISQDMPELRWSLRSWLEETKSVSTPIRIVARKVLPWEDPGRKFEREV